MPAARNAPILAYILCSIIFHEDVDVGNTFPGHR